MEKMVNSELIVIFSILLTYYVDNNMSAKIYVTTVLICLLKAILALNSIFLLIETLFFFLKN